MKKYPGGILASIIVMGALALPCFAGNPWEFQMTHETGKLIDSPFFLNTAADLNNNGKKEIIAADFGLYGDHYQEGKQWRKFGSPFQLFVLEWEKDGLATRWSRKWDFVERSDGTFNAYRANRMVSWEIGGRVVVETFPPYLGLEWSGGKYVLHEQQVPAKMPSVVGSWALSWLGASCHYGYLYQDKGPRECLLGIRDFGGDGKPKIVTKVKKEIAKDKYKQTLRVRGFEPGFPIEWEKQFKTKLSFGSYYQDRLNATGTRGLLLFDIKSVEKYLFEKYGNEYRLSKMSKEFIDILPYDLFDTYLRRTRDRGVEEYWGYRKQELKDHPQLAGNIFMLRRVTLKPDLGYEREDFEFKHHEGFLGVGFFNPADLDGDGLDELIVVEETAGKFEFGHESVYYKEVKDYIHILKWDGKGYRTMWVSPPYTKRGTKFLVDDFKGTGKKQLAVLTSHGTIQVWERK